MGTTLVAMALVEVDGEERLAIINVGDSRLYLLRQGELEQLTTDHSLVQELVDIGELSEADAAVHPQRNVLTRALGVDPSVVGRSSSRSCRSRGTGTCCAATGCRGR